MGETLWGAVIGGLLAVAGGYFAELHKYHLEKMRFKKEKMVEAYEIAEKNLYQMASVEVVPVDEVRKTAELMCVKISLYASEEVEAKFKNVSKEIMKNNKSDEDIKIASQKNEELVKLMRKDLGIDK